MSKSFDMVTIRPRGTYSFSDGIEWSVPIPTTYGGVRVSLSVAAVTPEVILLRYSPTPEMWLMMNLGWQTTAASTQRRENCLGAQ